jgi:hypothetical protein
MVKLNKCKERFSPIWDFVKGKWKLILTVLFLTGIVILTILLNYFGYLDTYQFLTDLFSGLIIVITGWILAWIIVHRYQRRNIDTQNKNKLIEEIAAFKISLRETTRAWFRCADDIDNKNLWYSASGNRLDIETKREILYFKLLNIYSNYLKKEFRNVTKENKSPTFKLKDLRESFDYYVNEISNGLNARVYDDKSSKSISKYEREVLLYLSAILLDIIGKPISKEIKKNN